MPRNEYAEDLLLVNARNYQVKPMECSHSGHDQHDAPDVFAATLQYIEEDSLHFEAILGQTPPDFMYEIPIEVDNIPAEKLPRIIGFGPEIRLSEKPLPFSAEEA